MSQSHTTSTAPAPAPGQPGYWRWLHTQMLAALADGSFLRFNGYTVAGRTFSYRSLADFRKLLDWVGSEADLEEGRRPYRGRVYAGQGGRR